MPLPRHAGIGAGDLKESVALFERVVGRDAHGAQTVTWNLVATVRAALRDAPYRPKESRVVAAAQPVAVNTVELVIRRRDDVGVTMRAEWGGRRFDIEAVNELEVGKRRYLRLFCTEVQVGK